MSENVTNTEPRKFPVDDVITQLRESLEGLGKTITNLEDRLHFVSNKYAISDDKSEIINVEKRSSDSSPLLSQLQAFNFDIKSKRDYIIMITDKLDI